MIGIYLLLVVLIISGSYYILSAWAVRDYLLAVAGVSMLGTGGWMLAMVVGV